jgi:Tol biopolymer transport system component
VKVLDFGLAKAMASEALAAGRPEASPTLTMRATMAGVILGTAAYMSPEQARGEPVDKRADIWAFGVVLWEMLTGKRLFEGKTISDVLAAVIRDEPDLTLVPAKVRPLLNRCLEKDPRRRLRDIGDAMGIIENTPESIVVSRNWLPWAVAVVLLIALGILLVIHFREEPPRAAEAVRFQIFPPPNTHFSGGPSISPDGRCLAFGAVDANGRTALWIRCFDSVEPRLLPGTEGVRGVSFWSPDSRFLAFHVQNKLNKIAIAGGPPQLVADRTNLVIGGAWTRDGKIMFGDASSGAWRVPAAGGVAEPLTRLDPARQENAHMLPSLLPDQRHFVYHRRSTRTEYTGTYIGSLGAKPEEQDSKQLLKSLTGAAYVPGADNAAQGYLFFLRDSTLMAQPFDAGRLKLEGEAVPVAEGVGSHRDVGNFAISANGVLAYRGGGNERVQLTWFDRQGNIQGNAGNPGPYYSPDALALSPDETKVATRLRDDQTGNLDIWVLDTVRNTRSRLTSNPAVDDFPVWSPDAKRIAFASNRDGQFDLYQKNSSGAGVEEVLLRSDHNKYPQDWSRDGRFLLYSDQDSKTKGDLWLLPLSGDHKPIPFLRTEFNEAQGKFSPDGRWIAYRSDKSGRPEIYVRPTSESAGEDTEWTISNGGGTMPRWRRDGKELFYFTGGGTLVAVEVSTNGTTFKAGISKPLFDTRIIDGDTAVVVLHGYYWDVSGTGSRFLINTATPESGLAPITVVLNWTAGLRK